METVVAPLRYAFPVDAAVKALLQGAKATSSKGLAQGIPSSFSSSFDLTFTPGEVCETLLNDYMDCVQPNRLAAE